MTRSITTCRFGPCRGRRRPAALDIFLKPAQAVDFAVLHIAAVADTVLTERLDTFVIGASRVELPIAGIFDLRDGKIAVWRDYFDLATWTKQANPSAG